MPLCRARRGGGSCTGGEAGIIRYVRIINNFGLSAGNYQTQVLVDDAKFFYTRIEWQATWNELLGRIRSKPGTQ